MTYKQFVQVEVNHAGEIDEIFDAISYRKGASVIRMLQSYLGAETFQVSLLLVCLFPSLVSTDWINSLYLFSSYIS